MNTKFARFMPFVAILIAGCDSNRSVDALSEATSESVPLFSEGKGVLFSDETRKLFGLEVADATERPIQRHFEKAAEIYRAARGERPGAALVLCSASEAKELSLGQPVALRSVSDSGFELVGKLLRLDTQTQAALGRVEALIEFFDPAGKLDVGGLVLANFVNGEAKPVLAVPAAAILGAADGTYVYTVNGSHLTRTRVKAGAASEGFVAIEDGLYAGDVVAAKGVDQLWLVELSALKGGTPCCPVPKKEAVK